MSNFLFKRKFNNQAELISKSREYFEKEPFIMIETYYQYIGINKYDYKNWRKSSNPEFIEYAKIIDGVREVIHNHLARVITYGQTEEELKHTKVTLSKGNGKSTWDYGRANPNMLKHYLKSRFKDNWEEEAQTQDKVTINIGNSGPNALLGDKDA